MTALEGDAEKYLLRLAKDQAAIINTLFEKVEAETGIMAKFAYALMKEGATASEQHGRHLHLPILHRSSSHNRICGH